MVNERIKNIKDTLHPPNREGRWYRKRQRNKLNEINTSTNNLLDDIRALKDVVDKHYKGTINLSTEVDSINWSGMPQEVASCFRPEFDYQPEEITSFSVVFHSNSNGCELIGINLTRNGKTWSEIGAGACYQGGQYTTILKSRCIAPQAQKRSARRAMKSLEFPTRPNEIHPEVDSMVQTQYKLDISSAILGFTINEIEKYIGTADQILSTPKDK